MVWTHTVLYAKGARATLSLALSFQRGAVTRVIVILVMSIGYRCEWAPKACLPAASCENLCAMTHTTYMYMYTTLTSSRGPSSRTVQLYTHTVVSTQLVQYLSLRRRRVLRRILNGIFSLRLFSGHVLIPGSALRARPGRRKEPDRGDGSGKEPLQHTCRLSRTCSLARTS